MDQIKKFLSFNFPKKQSENSKSYFKDSLLFFTELFNNLKEVFIIWVVVPIVMGSVLPTFPFFVVLGILYGFFKYCLNTTLYNIK